jgi:hypothetical protein
MVEQRSQSDDHELWCVDQALLSARMERSSERSEGAHTPWTRQRHRQTLNHALVPKSQTRARTQNVVCPFSAGASVLVSLR